MVETWAARERRLNQSNFRDYWIDNEMMLGGHKEVQQWKWNAYSHLAESGKLQYGSNNEKEWIKEDEA